MTLCVYVNLFGKKKVKKRTNCETRQLMKPSVLHLQEIYIARVASNRY